MYLIKQEIIEELSNNRLVIRPLLEYSQINNVSIDFRLGYDFLVSIQGRNPFIDASLEDNDKGNISTFFQETRRNIGDTFILHPNQTILASSLEYFKLPDNLMATIHMRSSYARLGINIFSSLEPGYCGCCSIELTNTSKIPIKMTVGARLFQAKFIRLSGSQNYYERERKYLCQVRPQMSDLHSDAELNILNSISNKNNNVI